MRRFVILASVVVILAGLFLAGPIHALAETELEDGMYLVPFTFEGGTGKGGVESIEASAEGGQITKLYVYMTSHNYDYCVYYGDQYINTAEEGNSCFILPYVEEQFLLTADTVAMSQPHEIDYTVMLDLDSIEALTGQTGGFTYVMIAGAVLAGIIVLVAAMGLTGRKR
ncbi:MAG: hypothetical protein IJT40_02225 [Firmicutes bacterium]|nr:hypothetical protein [Bacillota bacterium]